MKKTFALAVLLAGTAGPSAFAQMTQPTTATAPEAVGPGIPAFWVRPGYKITLAADNIPNARFMEFDDKGTLYISRPGPGDILALRDKDGDGVYEARETFTSGKPSLHGLCFADGWLWYTQSGVIWKAHDTNGDGKADDEQAVIPDGQLPKGGGHWWRPILVTSNALYTGIGDDGNLNDHRKDEREKLFRYGKDGTGKTPFVSGIRNTEKLRLRPGTTEVWGADHGSDWMGQPLGDTKGRQPITNWNPPCEFNQYTEGNFYGHPFITGNMMPRLEFKDAPDLLELEEKTTPPEWRLGAHWAPNGFTFLSKPYFSDDHQGDAFIACHGSWNSTSKVGYRVERVLFDKVSGKPYGSLMVVGTLAPDGKILGRPVDCVEAPDGSVLLSDDQTGQIYRIQRAGASVGKSASKILIGQQDMDKKNPKKRGAHENKGR